MSQIDRKAEEAWLLRREATRSGLPFPVDASPPAEIDEHELRRVYDSLGAELEDLPVLQAPAGWHDRLEAALDAADSASAADHAAGDHATTARAASRAPTSRWRRTALMATPLVAAAALLLLYLVVPRGGDDPISDVAISTERAGSDPRSTVPAVGDLLRAQARLPGGGELRLYRGDLLVARCPGHAGCSAVAARAEIQLRVDRVGRYRALAISMPHTPVTGSFDGDVREARARGAHVQPSSTLSVQ